MLYIIFTDLILSQHQLNESKTMMKFTFDELVRIERKLDTAVKALSTLVDSDSYTKLLDAKYIIAEVRHCAQTLEMPDEQTRPDSLKARAIDRLASMVHTTK
jgi:hypothetical protein